MLKINKTLSKVKLYHIGIITLICGVMPGLMGLSYYGPVEKVSAASAKTLSDITEMQQMRASVCENSAIGESNTLTDTRDNSTYTVAKLSDSKCWMTQNLRITRETINAKDSSNTTGKITSADSNVNANHEIPASTTGAFDDSKDSSGFYTNQQVRASADDDYGAYYSYNVATVNTVATASSGSATYDICPKGWRLPTGGSSGEFQALYNKGKSDWTTNGGKNGYWIGGTANAAGAAFFQVAGVVGDDGLRYPGSNGYYWSSTISSATSAYSLDFGSGIYPTNNRDRCLGNLVRCIASDLEDDDPNLSDQKDVDIIAIVVPPVISIDATSGMNKEVDPNLVTKGEISATISANTTYTVQLSANKTSLTNSQNPEETEITNTNSISASSNVQAKTNAWGILNQDNSTYSAITSTPTVYYNTESTNEDSSRTHTFILGVSVSPTLPAGEYSTTVTITAVNN